MFDDLKLEIRSMPDLRQSKTDFPVLGENTNDAGRSK